MTYQKLKGILCFYIKCTCYITIWEYPLQAIKKYEGNMRQSIYICVLIADTIHYLQSKYFIAPLERSI